MKREIYAICGCPRSGTTWLHNTLIEAGRFRGIPGEDGAPASRGVLVTDENQYSHALLMRLAAEGRSAGSWGSRLLLSGLKSILVARFGTRGGVMVKSPYYSFFADVMYRHEFGDRFIYLRREIHSVALSMLNHAFLSGQLNGGPGGFSSMVHGGASLETLHLPAGLAAEFVDRYDSLTVFDRALFKCLCFASAFAASRRYIPPSAVFLVRYESLARDCAHLDLLCDFLRLDGRQKAFLLRSFRSKPSHTDSLPPHDPALRRRIIEAEASVWERG